MLPAIFANEALALSCLTGVYDLNIRHDETVPPDVVLIGGHSYLGGRPRLRLVDRDDVDLPVTVEWSAHAVRLTPTVELPHGRVRLIEDDGMGYGVTRLGFNVSGSPEALALQPPDIREVERVTLEHGGDEPARGVNLRLGRAPSASTHEIALASDETFADAAIAWSTASSPWVGDGGCGPNIEGYDHDAEMWVRVRSVGIDGTVSAWSESVEVPPEAAPESPEPAPTGCAMRPGAPVGAGLVVVGLLGFRRRRG